MSQRSDRAAAVAMVALPPLAFSAKILFGGGGWMAAMLFFILALAWLVWYLGLALTAGALWKQKGVFAPDGGAGDKLLRGSIVAQLGLFTFFCLLLTDFTDEGEVPSTLGRLLGLSFDEEIRLLTPVVGSVALVAAPGVLVAFLFMIVMMVTIWFRRERRGPRERRPGL